MDMLKDLTQALSNWVLSFVLNDYNDLLKYSYTKEYIDLPDIKKLGGYLLLQAIKRYTVTNCS